MCQGGCKTPLTQLMHNNDLELMQPVIAYGRVIQSIDQSITHLFAICS